MKFIGKGAFTRCYLKEDGKTVQLVSCDPVKECMAFGWLPAGGLFPEVRGTNEMGVYEMDYLPYSRSLRKDLDAEDFKLYLYLKALMDGLRVPANRYDSYLVVYQGILQLLNREKKKVGAGSPYIKEKLEELLEGLNGITNCGSDVWMEISPRNVRAVNGKLVLLDCFFSIGKLLEVRQNAKR